MTRLGFVVFLLAAVLLALGPEQALAQGQFQILTGEQLDAAMVNSVTIEGKEMPVATRTATLVQSPSGGRAFLGLVDSPGYSSDVASHRYIGLIVTEGGNLSIGGKPVAPGSYAFGWAVPPKGDEGPGKFSL
jgi:hypothetical protein